MNALKENRSPLTNLQLELLKSLKYMASEAQVAEVKSLLRYYFARQLDSSIDRAENERNYTTSVYEGWLNASNDTDNISASVELICKTFLCRTQAFRTTCFVVLPSASSGA